MLTEDSLNLFCFYLINKYKCILIVQKLSADFSSLKFQFKMAAKKKKSKKFQSICQDKITVQILKWPPQKLIKPSPNIIVI